MAFRFDNACARQRLPPINLSGFLEYNFEYEKFSAADQSLEHISRLRIDAESYIVKPWIAQIRSGVGLTFRDQDAGEESRTGEFVGFDLNLRLFPFSRFPFEAFVLRSDDVQDGKLLKRDTQRTRYGFTQRYTSERYGVFNLRLVHEDRLQDELALRGGPRPRLASDSSDLVNFGYRKSFGRHRFDLRGDWNRLDRDEERQDVDRLFTTLRHNFNTGAELSVENRLTYDDQTLSDEDFTFSSESLEFNNNTFWRPRTVKPLLVNGLVRMRSSTAASRLNSSANDAVETKLRSATVNAGASYQWSERLRFIGNMAFTMNDTGAENTLRMFGRAGADYTSRDISLGKFRYNYFFGPRFTYLDDDAGSVPGVGLDLGHSLRRTVQLGPRRNITFNARQSGGFIEDGEGRSTQKLSHNASIGWSSRGVRSAGLIRLSASDSRTFGGGGRLGSEESDFQFINLQGTLDLALSRWSSVNGNVTIQATRANSPGVSSRAASGFDPSAAVSLTYLRRSLFNVRRMSFRSNLRLFSESYFPYLDEPGDANDREQTIWENRLDYQIGRLRLRLNGTLSRTQDVDRMFILFQVRRFFGNF